jgi:hypothetical protein
MIIVAAINFLVMGQPYQQIVTIGAPIVAGVLLIVLLRSRLAKLPVETKPAPQPTPVQVKAPAPPPAPPPSTAAVHMLSILQQDGRLIDFLQESIDPYSDAQIGAAVRAIHEGCRKTIAEHMNLEPVLKGEEGSEVIVPQGFDPSAIRLTGNVAGKPPFRGVLRHHGWKAINVKLPDRATGQDPAIVAPEEVEIP